jgi:hypothetical protein
MDSPDTRNVLSLALVAAAVLDLLMIPFLRSRLAAPQQPIIVMGMLSSAAMMLGLAAAFRFGWI